MVNVTPRERCKRDAFDKQFPFEFTPSNFYITSLTFTKPPKKRSRKTRCHYLDWEHGENEKILIILCFALCFRFLPFSRRQTAFNFISLCTVLYVVR